MDRVLFTGRSSRGRGSDFLQDPPHVVSAGAIGGYTRSLHTLDHILLILTLHHHIHTCHYPQTLERARNLHGCELYNVQGKLRAPRWGLQYPGEAEQVEHGGLERKKEIPYSI